jgi:hypothetical protein
VAKHQHWRTLYDYREDLQWVRMLGWSDADLKQVPVHEDATANEDYLNLANFSGTGLGVTSRAEGGGTSANVRGAVRNLYVYASEAPKPLYDRLHDLLKKGGPSGYEDGVFGKRGTAKDFPPK